MSELLLGSIFSFSLFFFVAFEPVAADTFSLAVCTFSDDLGSLASKVALYRKPSLIPLFFCSSFSAKTSESILCRLPPFDLLSFCSFCFFYSFVSSYCISFCF